MVLARAAVVRFPVLGSGGVQVGLPGERRGLSVLGERARRVGGFVQPEREHRQ